MNAHNKHVLIVDDDADFVEMVRSVLEGGGYEVDVAYNGRECLERVRARKPDLILLDIMMSTWNEGFEVADMLSESEEGKDIAVVLVSSMDLSSPLEPSPGLSSSLPVDACLAKPVKGEDLLKQVDTSLKHRAALAEEAEAEQEKEEPVILLVDDDVDFLEATAALLEANGYRVVRALDGASAREKLEEESPDLIVTDLMMESVLSGFMFSQQIKQLPRFKNIPVVFVTAIRSKRGFQFTPRRAELENAGIDAYFEKPVAPDQLLARVGELLGRGAEAQGEQ